MPQVVGALAVTFAIWGANSATALFLAQATVRLLATVALNALYSQLADKSRTEALPAGLRTAVTQAGGVNPTSFVLGTYATAGSMVTPPMSHGTVGATPNAYLTYVIELGDIRGMALSRLIIDGEYVALSASPDGNGFYLGQGRFFGNAWVKFYDGTQTAADPWLLTTYGSYPSRPWTSDMIGLDQCYAVVMFRFNQDVYSGFPVVRFEVVGIPLYDPRADTSVGGSGAQRWATPSTWVASSNPMVQIYNIMRGVSFADGSVWGGGVAAADLPLTEWFAAMNACDVATALLGGGTEAAYRTGIEVRSDDEPAAVIEELLKGCSGQLVDMGGVWKPKVGAVGLPVLFVTDGDVIVSDPQEYDPFPNLSATFNGVTATHPEPISLYESVSAPIRTNATDETADGGRRLIADLSLSAVPYKDQVQRLMEAYRLDNRRFRRHGLTLGPSAMVLEPTDSLSWTSTANGYTAKIFEVGSVSDDLMAVLQRVTIRERDSADYAWNAAADTKATAPVAGAKVIPAAQTVPSWNVTAVTLTGDVPGVVVPALSLTWNGADQDDVDALKYQIRLVSSGVTIIRGSTLDVDSGVTAVADGIVGSTAYEARAKFVVKGRATSWSSWVAATTGTATYIPGLGTFLDDAFTLQDNADPTKQARFQVSGVSAGTMRTLTVPNADGTIATLSGIAQTFANTTTFSGATVTVGTATGASTLGIGTGATTSGTTKSVNVGIAGVSGSITNVNIGSAVAGALGTTTISSPATVLGGTIRKKSYTVATLPSAATAGAGAEAYVTDGSVAHAGNSGTIVAGGGANFLPVYSDGTNWRIA